MNTHYTIFLLVSVLLIAVVILILSSGTFWRFGFKASYQTVKLPVRRISKYRNDRREHAFTIDYKDGSSKPQKVWIRRGDNNSVRPKDVAKAEVMIHTHPKTTSTSDPIQAAYENELRERPSAADLQHLQHSARDFELVMTPSGKIQKYEKIQKKGLFSKLRTDFKLSRAECSSQRQAVKRTSISNPRDARLAAKRSNEIFLKEASKEGFRVTRVKKGELRTEVKD